MTSIFFLFVIPAILAAIWAALLRKWRPLWSERRTATIAALPIPAILLGASIVTYVRAATTPPLECGLDACAMAMAGAMFMGTMSIGIFAVGVAASIAALRFMARR